MREIQTKAKLNSCFNCKLLDEGDAYHNKFYCDHKGAPRDEYGRYIEFSLLNNEGEILPIPDWCPYREKATEQI